MSSLMARPILIIILFKILSSAAKPDSNSMDDCTSTSNCITDKSLTGLSSCPMINPRSVDGSFHYYLTSNCIKYLGNNSQYITTSEVSLLYCGYNGKVGDRTLPSATITWRSPAGSVLRVRPDLRGASCTDTRLGLLVNTSMEPEGVYTCTVNFPDSVYQLFIGIYHTEAAPQFSSTFQVLHNVTVSGMAGVGLNWTTTNRPPGMVQWTEHTALDKPMDSAVNMSILRDKETVTYDHLLLIPWEEFSRARTFSVQLSSCVSTTNTTPVMCTLTPVPPAPSNISYKSSILSWTMESNRSSGVSLIEKYIIEYTPLNNSQCSSALSERVEVDAEQVAIEGVVSETVPLELEGGVEYTICVMSSNFRYNSNWTMYSFQVAAIDDEEGVYSNFTNYTTPPIAVPGTPNGLISMVIGIIVGLLFIVFIIMITVVCTVIHTRRRKRKLEQRTVEEWNDYTSADINFELEEALEIEPVIEDFPEDVNAYLGEYVIFYVNVSSASPSSITWFHNDQNVISDSSIEVTVDGTLSIPCVEDRHAGVYRMVASNSYGSSSCELKLMVTEEDSSSCDVCMSVSTDCEPIVVSSFEEYVASHHTKNNESFNIQFMSLNNFDEAVSVGASVENKHLNRYKHIYPYDKNRVSLEPINEYNGEQNTYINASYIKDLNEHTKFIASQAPLPSTVADFWHLVWQERVAVIVMLTNLTEGHRVRCQQYWPTAGSQIYGPFSVHLDKEDKLADYIIRRLTVFLTTSSEPPLSVTHYQFTSWPEHHMPDHAAPLLSLHSRALNKYKTANGHILVHCSSGVGRTGVFIALDIILEKAKKEGVVDVMGVVNKLRQQRMRIVQTVTQYIFVYDSVLECLVCGDTQIQACNVRLALKKLRVVDREEGKSGFEKQYQVLKRITPSQCEVGGAQLAGTTSTLNRSMASIVSERRTVPSGYIGATFIDGFRQKKAFIIVQGPSEDLCTDFWRMIMKYKCGGVVMLSDKFEYTQEVCCQYWPRDGAVIHGDISVELVSERMSDDVIKRIFSLTHLKSQEMSLLVNQFQILNWTPDGHCANYVTIISLLKDLVEVQMRTGNNPILIHCSDPVGRSAMLCAVMTVIERCKMEGIIDVFQVVKTMRIQKHGAIQSIDQYSFIFDIVLAYLDSMETYSNFR